VLEVEGLEGWPWVVGTGGWVEGEYFFGDDEVSFRVRCLR